MLRKLFFPKQKEKGRKVHNQEEHKRALCHFGAMICFTP